MVAILLAILLLSTKIIFALENFICAGFSDIETQSVIEEIRAKSLQRPTIGTRNAIVLFAKFRGERSNGELIPAWAAEIFNPEQAGSFSHFYATMSFDQLRVEGEVAPRRYESDQEVAVYLSADPTKPGGFGQFTLEILRQADKEIDFSRFDNDGPDGISNSGDDDGVVDAVFIVVASMPVNFLMGTATGIGTLGLETDFVTDDIGWNGQSIRISALSGTIQQGRTFIETVGIMCHEYGHILGLPDLFNVEFMQKKNTLPEEDSAGVGLWCLMGWGAQGWNGDDGPNSFCAWSRMRLGWAKVAEVTKLQEVIRLKEVGQSGEILKIPLTGQEFFLLEHRRRTGNYYDRNLPGEGLLIWHIEQPTFITEQVKVDLECADGRWLDAGYPLGKQSDSRNGGDNLDFWAHDVAYAQAHAGNLGDATDPFDGVRFRQFTPETNPDSYSNDGRQSIRLENILLEDNLVIAKIQMSPPLLKIRNLRLSDANGDSIIVSGEETEVLFGLANRSGLRATNVKVQLHTLDPLVEILQPEVVFRDLNGGQEAFDYLGRQEPIKIRFSDNFIGAHTTMLFLEVYTNGIQVEKHEFTLTALSPRQSIRGLTIVDSLGNGDETVQAGEFIRLFLILEEYRPAPFQFSLCPLSKEIRLVGVSEVRFTVEDDFSAVSSYTPEFLVQSTAIPGDLISFVFVTDTGFGAWKDTLFVEVQEGIDLTPPRVGYLQTRPLIKGAVISLPENQIWEGSAIRSATVNIYSIKDTVELATIPLHRQRDRYEGVWPEAEPGNYRMVAVVEDTAGNQGRSILQEISLLAPIGSRLLTDTGSWQLLGPPGTQWTPSINDIARSPSDQTIGYVTTDNGLWRSVDDGTTWTKANLMVSSDHSLLNEVLVDALDPSTIYLSPILLKSHDGGMHWEQINGLDPVIGDVLLAVDPVREGHLYACRKNRLLISEDRGISWNETGVYLRGQRWFVLVHPADPQVIYSGFLKNRDKNSRILSSGRLFCSADGGKTWDDYTLEHDFQAITIDPQDSRYLYAISQDSIWHSSDNGTTWRAKGKTPNRYLQGIMVHPGQSQLLFVWPPLWKSIEGGDQWELIDPNFSIKKIVVHPQDPGQILRIDYRLGSGSLYRTNDGGQQWQKIEMPEIAAPVGTVIFDRSGNMYAGSQNKELDTSESLTRPNLWISLDRGLHWESRTHEVMDSIIGRGYSFNVLQIDPVQPKIMIAYEAGVGVFLRTTDGGRIWERLFLGTTIENSLRIYPEIVADPQREGGYYIVGQTVYRSIDFGATWEERISGLPPIDWINGFAQDPFETMTLYVAIKDHVWRSKDTGNSWEDLGEIVPGQNIFALAIHPLDNRRLYAATTGGLYASEDGGRVWSLLLKPGIDTWSGGRIRFDPHNPATIYLVTGHQLLETTDAGKTWRSIGDNLADYPWFEDVAVDPFDSNLIYAATPWGMYRLDTRQVSAVVGEEKLALPGIFALEQNYPNPFNPQTTIYYQVPQTELVKLILYNIAGQVVKRLVDQVQIPGRYQVIWNGLDEEGREVSSGVYLYRLEAGSFRQVRRMLLVK